MSKRPIAFITGASRGIGRGIAIELAKRGYDIAGGSRVVDPAITTGGIFEVKQRVEELGSKFLPVQGDVSVLEDHERMVTSIIDQCGKIDLLVNNAGVAPEKRLDVLETDASSFDRVLSTNLRGPFFLTQRVAAQMIGQVQSEPCTGGPPWPPPSALNDSTAREGAATEDRPYRTGSSLGLKPKIVFITSVSAYMSSPSRAEYCVSKSGLSMAAAIFADRLAEFGINVFEVRPGIIKTDMTARVQDKYDALIEQGLIPQGRWGMPEDVGKAVAALVSGDLEYSTGTVIEVSGGMNIRRL